MNVSKDIRTRALIFLMEPKRFSVSELACRTSECWHSTQQDPRAGPYTTRLPTHWKQLRVLQSPRTQWPLMTEQHDLQLRDLHQQKRTQKTFPDWKARELAKSRRAA